MVTPSARVLAARRASAGKDAVAAALATLLVVCALVSGIVAALGPLQQQALQATLQQVPPDDTVVHVVSTYDPAGAQQQDQAVRKALAGVVERGGVVVRRAETVAFDPVGGGRARSFTSVTTGARTTDASADLLRAVEGRLPTSDVEGRGRPVEVAVPSRAPGGLGVGDRLRLDSRLEDATVRAVVVGTFEPTEGARRPLGRLPGTTLLVSTGAFDELAPRATAVRWRAAPRLADLAPGRLDDLRAATIAAEREVARADEQVASSLRVEDPLGGVLATAVRELVAQRTLLLVPSVTLLLLGTASALLVASALSTRRRSQEALWRSRGAGRGQLIAPTALEAALLAVIAASGGPLLGSLAVRAGGVPPALGPSAWAASAAAALVCGAALVLPTVVRAFSADGGEQLSVARRRRRGLTLMLAAGLLVLALGLAAVAGLRQFGQRVADTRGWADGVDPLAVASPALLLLALVAVLSLTLLPLLFRLTARAVRTRGVTLALGMRFASRAPSTSVPLALVVALATGVVSFALVGIASHEGVREDRAAYAVGADVQVTTPPASLRAGPVVERTELEQVTGVTAVAAVDRELDFAGDAAVEVVTAELAQGSVARELVASATDPDRVLGLLRGTADPEQALDEAAGSDAEGPGAAVPVAVTELVAEEAALDVGEQLELDVRGAATAMEVVAVLPWIPTVADGRGGLLVDTDALPGPAGTGPDEWWLAVDGERTGAVAAQLRDRPQVAGRVLTRAEATRRLAAAPITGGAALGDILAVTAVGALMIGANLLLAVVLLRRRERAEQADVLRTLGARDRDVTRMLGAEYALTTGVGAVAGVAAGLAVAALTLAEMTLGPGGAPLVPPPVLHVPWRGLLLTSAALVAVPLVGLLALARRGRSRTGGGRA